MEEEDDEEVVKKEVYRIFIFVLFLGFKFSIWVFCLGEEEN